MVLHTGESSILGYQVNEMIDGVVCFTCKVDGPITLLCNSDSLNRSTMNS